MPYNLYIRNILHSINYISYEYEVSIQAIYIFDWLSKICYHSTQHPANFKIMISHYNSRSTISMSIIHHKIKVDNTLHLYNISFSIV